jgi:hypothetical protein
VGFENAGDPESHSCSAEDKIEYACEMFKLKRRILASCMTVVTGEKGTGARVWPEVTVELFMALANF